MTSDRKDALISAIKEKHPELQVRKAWIYMDRDMTGLQIKMISAASGTWSVAELRDKNLEKTADDQVMAWVEMFVKNHSAQIKKDGAMRSAIRQSNQG